MNLPIGVKYLPIVIQVAADVQQSNGTWIFIYLKLRTAKQGLCDVNVVESRLFWQSVPLLKYNSDAKNFYFLYSILNNEIIS